MERTEPTFRCWIYFSAIGQFGFDQRSELAVVLVVLLGSLTNMNDRNRKENVTWKENMHCLKLNRAHSVSFNSSVLASISGVEFLKTVSNFGRWERNSLSRVAHKTWNKEVFTSKSCCLWQQRNVQCFFWSVLNLQYRIIDVFIAVVFVVA